ncbi:hypothetical protein RRG08_048205 [Elysia crispata]|uniref:Uncharacterized protein n=1 Tax=Elysia crispata TaxID=231223 RepID=A0AAE0YAL3_9GAST|nr:hypothetical protein RRG08_048205 [Elysia crispata]
MFCSKFPRVLQVSLAAEMPPPHPPPLLKIHLGQRSSPGLWKWDTKGANLASRWPQVLFSLQSLIISMISHLELEPLATSPILTPVSHNIHDFSPSVRAAGHKSYSHSSLS